MFSPISASCVTTLIGQTPSFGKRITIITMQMKQVNEHCLLDTLRKVIVDINSSSVQNIKKKSIATTTYHFDIHAKFYMILKIMKQDRQEKSVMDI